ncbi:hypothetical protein M2262_001644 [Pseudomonas sp. BIGb0408]|uniref:Uncharacterized protein n=1 Tax=Phytopseudomonas flavescens TaxID=29435 RepID=A0A7Z0BPD9_9GAMM|nr:hypothetical protein [Pseudomonas sp. BIGb0408]NYH73835.1 hypothetical protein [Pseudomonas flavescens]
MMALARVKQRFCGGTYMCMYVTGDESAANQPACKTGRIIAPHLVHAVNYFAMMGDCLQ